MGFEPMNTGFADQRVNHFAIGASWLFRETAVAPNATVSFPLMRQGTIYDPLLRRNRQVFRGEGPGLHLEPDPTTIDRCRAFAIVSAAGGTTSLPGTQSAEQLTACSSTVCNARKRSSNSFTFLLNCQDSRAVHGYSLWDRLQNGAHGR
jgi:hypothetical protein